MSDAATTTSATPSAPVTGKSRLYNKDMTLIIDISGSMSMSDVPGYKSRYHAVQETAEAIARKMDEYDPDGNTLYVFNGSFRRYDNVKPAKVSEIFAENEPTGGTNLHLVLEDAFKHWRQRKNSGQLKGGEIIGIITDGVPNDEAAVAKAITNVTKDMDDDEELALQFYQVGQDASATQFLKRLDDNLPAEGAKFDTVDTTTFADLENTTITQTFLNAIDD